MIPGRKRGSGIRLVVEAGSGQPCGGPRESQPNLDALISEPWGFEWDATPALPISCSRKERRLGSWRESLTMWSHGMRPPHASSFSCASSSFDCDVDVRAKRLASQLHDGRRGGGRGTASRREKLLAYLAAVPRQDIRNQRRQTQAYSPRANLVQ